MLRLCASKPISTPACLPCAGKYDQVRINFANPDMVGHTGDLEATRGCCALVDQCVKVGACCRSAPSRPGMHGRLEGARRCRARGMNTHLVGRLFLHCSPHFVPTVQPTFT